MNYYLPKGCYLFLRKSDKRWEARIMLNGKQKFVASGKIKTAVYNKLMIAHKKKKHNLIKVQDGFTLFSWLDHWHTIYRMPKIGKELSENTIISDLSMIRKIKKVFKDKKLIDLTGDYIQATLNSMDQGRTCEGVYTILKLALDKARDRTNGFSVMKLVEKPTHERIKGRALSKEEIHKLLNAARNDTERDVIKFYIYTGVRVDEISSVKIKHINLTNISVTITDLKHKNKIMPDISLHPNEIFINGSKTKGSLRTMPIMPPLKPILEKLIANRDADEKLFPFSTVVIRNFHKLLKEKTGISFTLKDYRHTAATNFKDAGIPSSVYFRWFGWSDDTMARKVYTHATDYEMKVSQEWAAKFE